MHNQCYQQNRLIFLWVDIAGREPLHTLALRCVVQGASMFIRSISPG
jgi:hypothetical protein